MSPPLEHVCSRCAHPNDPNALTCSACGAYLLVDLLVEEAIADPRGRYHAAKAIAAKGRPFPEIARASRDLQVRGSTLVAGMSRAAAASSVEVLAAIGVRARITPTVPPAPAVPSAETRVIRRKPFDRVSRPMVVAVGAVAAAFLVLRAILAPSDSPKGPAPLTPGRIAPASAVAASGPQSPVVSTPAVREIVARALEATAMLRCRQTAGAGFFVAPDILITNHHVTCGPNEDIQITMRSGRTLTGIVLRSDPWLDLALVRAPGAGAPALSLGDSTGLAAGDRVLAVGNPIGLAFTVNQGMISHNERQLLGIGYVQFDGNINPGNSGGPLVDLEGNAVGIVSMMARDSRGLSFAIPVNYLYEGNRPFLDAPAAPAVKGHGERWKQFLARIRADEDREVAELASAFQRPGLAAGVMDVRGIAAVIVRRNGTAPTAERMYFRVSQEGRQVCTASGYVESWRRMDAGGSDMIGDGRYIEWMQKHGISAEIWVGATRITGSGCPDSTASSALELVLDGADPHADRVMLRKTSFENQY